MNKQRIQVYTDPATKRRIELAAAKVNLPVTEYCLRAIEQQLADDGLLDAETVTIPVTPQSRDAADWLAEMRALHRAILAERGGEPIDVDAELEQMRAEREDELDGELDDAHAGLR